MHFRGQDGLVDLAQRADVVQNPEASPVGRRQQVAETLLDGQPIDRRVGQVGLQGTPANAVVEETHSEFSVPR